MGSLLALAASGVWYVLYESSLPDGARGGTWQGLVFGIVGSALMLFAGVLGMRKKAPKWRIGRMQTWLRGHIWLGLLSVPMILFHSGFRLGGFLEQVLMLVFGLVIVSGFVGLALQQYLPRIMTTAAPAQAIFDQLPAVCVRLRSEAEAILLPVCGPLWDDATSTSPGPLSPKESLRFFYTSEVHPFLQPQPPADAAMLLSTRALQRFSQLERALPDQLQPMLADIRAICDERRMLLTQERYQRWLHGWLIVHVPLSMALLVLGILHAVMSLYY